MHYLNTAQRCIVIYRVKAVISLVSLWPLPSLSSSKPASITAISNKLIAMGYGVNQHFYLLANRKLTGRVETGEIRVLPTACAFSSESQAESDTTLTLRGHVGAVTCLYAPAPKDSGG